MFGRSRRQSMATKYRVIQVKGAAQESFLVVGIDFEAGTITNTTEMMREAEMRTFLERSGASANEIEEWIKQARQYPGEPMKLMRS
jgi:hypothetical protein